MIPTTLADLVGLGASQRPDHEAVRADGVSLTYAELHARTSQLAATLTDHGIGVGDRVGVFCTKSLETMVAVHGILASGAAYVPIDPFAPPALARTVLASCGVDVVVSHPPRAKALGAALTAGADALDPARVGEPIAAVRLVIGAEIEVDGCECISWADVAATPAPASIPTVQPADVAYIMYTSGSTGAPKGIVHTHASGLAYARMAAINYGLGPADRMANVSPLHFDMSTFEIFAGPFAQATTVMVPEPLLRFPASLSQMIEDESITIWYSVPFLLVQLLERGVLDERSLDSLRWIVFGGEVMAPLTLGDLMRALPRARFSNSYGPAEVNQCTFHHFDEPPSADRAVPIGEACVTADLLLIDTDDRPITDADGQGELIVRASTAMAGYWRRDDLTEKAFIAIDDEDGRWYRTGDLVQRRADGYVFLGRLDNQVKVRGHRVELESVETVLSDIDGISHAVAGPIRGAANAEVLAAVVIAGADFDERATLRTAASYLPAYAVPTSVIAVDELPLTGSGKIDRRRVRSDLRAGIYAVEMADPTPHAPPTTTSTTTSGATR